MNPFRWLVSCLPYSRARTKLILRDLTHDVLLEAMQEIGVLRSQREREESKLHDAINRVVSYRAEDVDILRRELRDLERRLCDAAVAEAEAKRPSVAWQDFQNATGLYAGPEAAGMPTVDEPVAPKPVRWHRLHAFLRALWPFPRWIQAAREMLSTVNETAANVTSLKESLRATESGSSHPSAREGDASDPYGSTESPGTVHPLNGAPFAPYDPNMKPGVERVDNPYDDRGPR